MSADAADAAREAAAVVTIDAHQHVWDLDRSAYAWLDAPQLTAIRRSFPAEAAFGHFDAAGIDGSVLVQADDTDADTDTMVEAARLHPRVVGVVGWVPLEDPDRAEERLAELRSPAFVGVRALIHTRADPDWLLRPDVDEGLGVLERLGVPFDLVAVLPRHLEHAATLGTRHPGLRIVIDHLAKPPVGGAAREPWWTLIARAAENPLVTAKLSGLYPPTGDPAAWTTESLEPFVDRALEVFGPDRLMYGGDWPFSIPAGDYGRTWSATTRLLARLDPGERDQVLGGTAARHYRLDPARLSAAAAARRHAAAAARRHAAAAAGQQDAAAAGQQDAAARRSG